MEAPGLNHRQFEALAALGAIRSYPRRTIVFQEGDETDQIYLVLSGKVRVFLADADGKEIVLDTLGAGQYFGEMALDGRPRSASVIATEASKLAVVPKDAFKRFLAEQPDAAFALMVTVIRRARNLTRVVGNLALLDVYGRVARLLLDGAVEQNGELVLTERVTQREMASRVGASREMVSRILTDLRDGGYISVVNERIVIHQVLPERW